MEEKTKKWRKNGKFSVINVLARRVYYRWLFLTFFCFWLALSSSVITLTNFEDVCSTELTSIVLISVREGMHNQAALLLEWFDRAAENEANKTRILNREIEAYFAWLLRITSPRSAYNSLYNYKPYSIIVYWFIYNTRHISKDSRDIFCPLNVVSGITEAKNNQHWEGRSTPFLSKYGCCTRYPNLVWRESQQNNMWSFNVHLVIWFLALTLFFLPALFLLGYFAYTGSSHKAKLETPWISVSAGNSVPLCLTFNYSMRSSNASFNVSCKTSFTNEENLIFKLNGYHGKTWFKGQVLWKAEGTSRVIFFLSFSHDLFFFFLSFLLNYNQLQKNVNHSDSFTRKWCFSSKIHAPHLRTMEIKKNPLPL